MNRDHERPIDFSPLDPTTDQERFKAMVEGIVARAAHELATRRTRFNPFIQLASWRRPMLAAAAVVAVVSATILTRTQVPQPAVEPETDGIAEAVGVPVELAQWIWDGEVPTTADLFAAFDQ